MTKATDKLLADHKMIRKLLKETVPENPRFPELAQTLHRIVKGHAWFEDVIFLPALEKEPLLQHFSEKISEEHKDIQYFLKALSGSPQNQKELEAYSLQLHVLLDTHFAKEEDALFPLAERILDSEGLNSLGDEMERRKTEVRHLMEDRPA